LGGVITGIGFLGAGALIRSNDRVFGFTTAALVWAMAALGVAAGAGLYYLAFVNYGIVWAVVLTDRYLESKGFGSHAKVVHLTVEPDPRGRARRPSASRPGRVRKGSDRQGGPPGDRDRPGAGQAGGRRQLARRASAQRESAGVRDRVVLSPRRGDRYTTRP